MTYIHSFALHILQNMYDISVYYMYGKKNTYLYNRINDNNSFINFVSKMYDSLDKSFKEEFNISMKYLRDKIIWNTNE